LTSTTPDRLLRAVFIWTALCYNITMQNWSVNIGELKKNKERYAIWKLEQMVNFGLGKQKLSREKLEKYWNKLNLDENKKKYLSMILCKKPY